MENQSVIPVLYSEDIARSLAYYIELRALKKWTWKDPPIFGGIFTGETTIFL